MDGGNIHKQTILHSQTTLSVYVIFETTLLTEKNEVLGKEDYEQHFSEFCQIGRRIDVYLGNRKRRNNSSISKCELEVLECKTCPMDYNLKVKYENALKAIKICFVNVKN